MSTPQKRDSLTSEFNKLAVKASDLRSAENSTEELIEVTAQMRSIESELSVLNGQDAPAVKVEVVKSASDTLGDAVVRSGISALPVGSTTEIEKRDIFQGPAGGSAQPYLFNEPGAVYGLPTLPTSFLDLLPVVPTSGDGVRYFKQVLFTNNADGINGQLVALPQSEVTWTAVYAPVSKVGHFMIVSDETLSDEPALAALINREGIRGIREQIEKQLLATSSGNGDVASLVAGAQTETWDDEGQSIMSAIRKAKTKAEVAGLPADFIVVSPAIRELIDLGAITDSGGAGYFSQAPSTVFGLNIVTCYNLPAGIEAVVGSTQAVRLRSRSGVEVSTSNSHAGLFITDGVAVKVKARLAVENVRAEAFVKIVRDAN
jgi:hypothetical protein